MKFTSERSEREIMSKRVEESLCDAATSGDLELLTEIMAKDNYILDKVEVGCFGGRNPLHLAIAAREAEFVERLLEINPKLAEVVDAELGAALHIAAGNGNRDLRIVEALVRASPGMCASRDRYGNNPLHIAAMKGNVEVLEKLVRTCPAAALGTSDRGETILHMCVKYDQLGSLQLLLESSIVPGYINVPNARGKTILHTTISFKRIKILEHLLNHTEINVNARCEGGATAMDVFFLLQNGPHKTEADVWTGKFLLAAGAQTGKSMMPFLSEDAKASLQTLVVVATLFATMSFQVVVNPPGGVWQDNLDRHVAGKAILAYKYPKSYSCFIYFNTVGFLLSLTLIQCSSLYLIPPALLIQGISLSAIMTVAFVYLYSVIVVSPKHMTAGTTYTILVSVVVWAFVMLLFIGVSVLSDKRTRTKDRKRMSILAGEMPRPLPSAVGENVEVSVETEMLASASN